MRRRNPHHQMYPDEPPKSMLSLDSILAGPLPGCRFVPSPIGFVYVGDLGDERVIGIGVGEHRADGEEDYGRIRMTKT